MRKFIIDTDTAADDAVALLMALSSNINILGITTVCGNVPLSKACLNALQVVELSGQNVPVYKGAEKPLLRKLYTAEYVHGLDGMGDKGLVNPTIKANDKNAIDFILNTVSENPDEIEIIALGPVTNIAKAILKAPDTMKKVKHIYTMGTAGLSDGNVTKWAEFNVYVDAESYDIMLKSGIPITVIGLDMCMGDALFSVSDLEEIEAVGKKGKFVRLCTSKILEHNTNTLNIKAASIPDAVAMSCVLWEDTVLGKDSFLAVSETKSEEKYGRVTFRKAENENCTLITSFNSKLFKEHLLNVLK